MKIQVTDYHIQYGMRGRSRYCPVALALPKSKTCNSVNKENLADWLSGRKICALPREVKEFISKFDDGKQVKPFEFSLSAECFMN